MTTIAEIAARQAAQPQHHPDDPAAPAAVEPSEPTAPPTYADGEHFWRQAEADRRVRSQYFDPRERCFSISLDGREPAILDRGGRLDVKQGTPETAALVIEAAKAREWQSVRVSGPTAFKRMCWWEAAKAGLDVEGYQPSQQEQRMLAEWKAGQASVAENTIRPAAPSPAAPVAQAVAEVPKPEPEQPLRGKARFKKAVADRDELRKRLPGQEPAAAPLVANSQPRMQ